MNLQEYKGSLEEIKVLQKKSWGSLKSSKILLNTGEFADSISRSYYAILHAARALLLSEGYFAKTHDGVITLFSLKFIKTHKIDARYVRIFKEAERDRIDADYRFLEEFTKQDAESVHKKAEEFVKMADKFLSVKLKGRKRNSIDIRGMLW